MFKNLITATDEFFETIWTGSELCYGIGDMLRALKPAGKAICCILFFPVYLAIKLVNWWHPK